MKQTTNLIHFATNLPAIVVLAAALFFRSYLYCIGTMVSICIVTAVALVFDIVSSVKHKTGIENAIVSGLLILITLAAYLTAGYLHAKEMVWGCFGIGILVAYFVYLCIVQNANNKIATENVLLYSITLLSTYFLTA